MIKQILSIFVACFICAFAATDKQIPFRLFDSVELAKSTIPAVVNVYAYRNQDNEVFQPFDLGDLESMLFGTKRYGSSSGTGCIISTDGIIVTCNHVVEQAARIFVGLNDGRRIQAVKIFANVKADIAFLKINANDLPYLKLADSKTSIDLGEEVLVAGNALDMGKTSIFHGLISFINRVIDGKVVLQSDAHIGVGNSGGPMVNSVGEMIGMAFAIPRMGGLSFFIPASMILYYYNKEILKKPSPWWGIQVQPMTPDMLEGSGLEDKNVLGVIVTSFASGSPANGVLKQGDIIIAINGQKLNTPEELDFFEKTSILGESVNVKVWRDKDFVNVNLTSIKEPETMIQEVDDKLLGDVLFEDTTDGVVVKRAEGNALFQEGDRVIAINKKKIKTSKDIKQALDKQSQKLGVVVKRNGVKIAQAFSASTGEGGSFFSQSIIGG